MYEYKNLLVNTAEDGITTVTINRPKALNALDTLTLEEMKDCFNRLASDVATKSVLITGAGPKSFVAGADLGAMSKMTVTEARCFSVLGHAVFNAIERIPVAVVAAINGFALGGGCELALACDFRFASDNAKFGQPEVNYGIIPGFGGSQRLARLIGTGEAKEMIYTGSMIDAEEALRIGLINRITTQENLIPECDGHCICKKCHQYGHEHGPAQRSCLRSTGLRILLCYARPKRRHGSLPRKEKTCLYQPVTNIAQAMIKRP